MGCITECTAGFAKYTLFLLNLLILVAAILLIAFGVKNSSDSAGALTSITGFTIGIGVFIALIAFFGCCGAVKESPCLLNIYATILIIFFILQVVLGALAFVAISNKDTDIKTTLSDQLLKIYKDYNEKNNKEEVDSIQKNLQCCGLTGKESLLKDPLGPLSSCCKEDIKPCTLDKKFDQTCDDTLANVLETNIRIIGGIAIGFSIVELVAATFACYVKCTR